MTAYPDDEDGEALRMLEAEGVDMSRRLTIDFAVAAPDEEKARAIEEDLQHAGYETQIEFDEGEPDEDGEIDPDDEEFGPSWTVFVSLDMLPDYNEIMRIQADLDRIARPHGGQSDGWGATVE